MWIEDQMADFFSTVMNHFHAEYIDQLIYLAAQ
jgi:hypothetical protein